MTDFAYVVSEKELDYNDEHYEIYSSGTPILVFTGEDAKERAEQKAKSLNEVVNSENVAYRLKYGCFKYYDWEDRVINDIYCVQKVQLEGFKPVLKGESDG